MNRHMVLSVIVATVFAAAALQGVSAQQSSPAEQQGTSGPGGGALASALTLYPTGSREFSTESTVAMVGFFLPPQERAQTGARASGGLAALRARSADPGSYLSAAQIARILPVVRELADNPYPSPKTARRIQAGIEDVLSRDQKKAWDDFVKAVGEQVERIQQQGGATAAQSQTPEQRQSTQAARSQQGDAGTGDQRAAQQRQLSPEQRRTQAVVALIQRLEKRQKDLGG